VEGEFQRMEKMLEWVEHMLTDSSRGEKMRGNGIWTDDDEPLPPRVMASGSQSEGRDIRQFLPGNRGARGATPRREHTPRGYNPYGSDSDGARSRGSGDESAADL
jgi:hypothetical protein